MAAAIILLVMAGAGYRALAGRLADVTGTVRLPRGTLATLSPDLGLWIGRELPLTEAVIRATDTDDHLSRVYYRPGVAAPVTMFVAYGIRLRDLVPHRPDVCFPAQGWTIKGSGDLSIPCDDGSTLPVQWHRFQRGGFGTTGVQVLNTYLLDGAYCADLGVLRSQSWKGPDRLRYAAQLQISTADDLKSGKARETLTAFAATAAPAVRALIEKAVSGAAATPIEE